MVRKWISAGLILVLVCTAVAAYGATPSKTTNDLLSIQKTVLADGSEDDGLVGVAETPSTAALKSFTEISAFVAEKQPVAEYFPAEVQQEIAALIPTGADAAQLTMSEYVDLTLDEYQAAMGDVTCTFSFATQFSANQTVIAMLGYVDAQGNVVWLAVPATLVDGMLQITFPADWLLKAGHDIVLAILSI